MNTYIDPRKVRIRKCDGNNSAWLMVYLNKDGTECSAFGSYITSSSLDGLFRHPDSLKTDKPIELVI